MYSHPIRTTALILAVLTAAWIVLMVVSTRTIQPDWGDREYAGWAAEAGTAYLLSYLNATLVTLFAALLFVFLFLHFRDRYEAAAWAGLLFIPAYLGLNLTVYTLQIHVVPGMAANAIAGNVSLELTVQLMQVNPDTLAGYLNGLAYGILGVPSILFGRILIKDSKRASGWFLLLNGIACIAGLAGYLSGIGFLTQGVVLGGVLFLISLVMMAVEFRRPVTAP